MPPAAAIPLFLVSIAVMLAASSVFAGRLDHIGLRLGLPEAVLGLLTALAADALNSHLIGLSQQSPLIAASRKSIRSRVIIT